jgi:lysyl-tRNA synthetase class 1
MFTSPRSAKKLYFDVIPRQVDDYMSHLRNFATQEPQKQIDNPAWHIHNGNPPACESEISFSVLLNLVSACNSDDSNVLWGFIKKYNPMASPETMPFLDKLVQHAINYYEDFIKVRKMFYSPSDSEKLALADLLDKLQTLEQIGENADAAAIQSLVFEVGKSHNFTDLKSWFMVLYRHLFGQEDGPRMGSFIALYGIGNTMQLIREALAR